jgi:hypothetical protein
MSYFAAALVFLMLGGALTVGGFGYPAMPIEAPESLIVVHILVIGWLGLLFCGALLQFVPVLVAKPLKAPGVAAPALAMIVAGLVCLTGGFLGLAGRIDAAPELLPVGGGLLALGFGALIFSLAWTLVSGRPLGVPAKLVGVALAALAVTVCLGMAFASVLSGVLAAPLLGDLLAAGVPFHAAFGLLGWMTLTAMGVSYKLFGMFMLSPEGGQAEGARVLRLAAVALVVLAAALFATVRDLPASGLVMLAAVALTFAVLAAYGADVLRIFRARRRKALELNSNASLVSLAFLAAGFVLFSISPLLADPVRLGAPAVYLLVMGWLTGLGLGQLYKIVPFLTWLECYGPVMGRTAVPRVQDLVDEERSGFWFWLHFMAVAFGGLCLAFEAHVLFRAVSVCQLLASAGLIFEFVQARRLALAPAPARLPKGAVRPHLIFPQSHTRS